MATTKRYLTNCGNIIFNTLLCWCIPLYTYHLHQHIILNKRNFQNICLLSVSFFMSSYNRNKLILVVLCKKVGITKWWNFLCQFKARLYVGGPKPFVEFLFSTDGYVYHPLLTVCNLDNKYVFHFNIFKNIFVHFSGLYLTLVNLHCMKLYFLIIFHFDCVCLLAHFDIGLKYLFKQLFEKCSEVHVCGQYIVVSVRLSNFLLFSQIFWPQLNKLHTRKLLYFVNAHIVPKNMLELDFQRHFLQQESSESFLD